MAKNGLGFFPTALVNIMPDLKWFGRANHFTVRIVWSCGLFLVACFLACHPPSGEEKSQDPASDFSVLRPTRIIPAGRPKIVHFDPSALNRVLARGRITRTFTQTTTKSLTNRFLAGAPYRFEPSEDPSIVIPGENGIPLPKQRPATGRRLPLITPAPTPATYPEFKDEAGMYIHYLGVDQGLNAFTGYDVLEDQKGFLWLATSPGGLKRYDGHHFTSYTRQHGLPSDTVYAMVKAKNGDLWAGLGNYNGVLKFNGVHFQHFAAKDGITGEQVTDLVEDRDSNIWIALLNQGLVKFDGSHFVFFSEKEGLINNDVTALAEGPDGRLWMGFKGGGLGYYQGGRFYFFNRHPALAGLTVNALFFDSRQNLWIATSSQGAIKFDGEQFYSYGTDQGLISNNVSTIAEDRSGQFWFGTPYGLCSFRPMKGSGEFRHFTEREGLSSNWITAIAKGPGGHLWMMTVGGGAVKIVPEKFQFVGTPEGLKSNPTRAIAEDHSGNLWVGTHFGDLSILPVYQQEQVTFTHFSDTEKGSRKWIISNLVDAEGKIWFTSFEGGLFRYDPAAQRGGSIFTIFDENSGLPSNRVDRLIQDSRGNLWMGLWKGGLVKYDGRFFTHFTEKDGLGHNTIITQLEDSRGQLWLGTNGGGLCRLSGDSIATYTEAEGLSHNVVRVIYEDRQGRLWLGTEGGGITQFDGTTFTHYHFDGGFSANSIRSIMEDRSGNFWITTVKKLFYVYFGEEPSDREKKGPVRYIEFGKEDGLRSSDFLQNSVLLDSRQQIWWGTEKGLVSLDLGHFQQDTTPPKIEVLRVGLNGLFPDYRNDTEIKELGIQIEPPVPFSDIPSVLRLPHQVNTLQFEVGAFDWAAQHKIHFQYFLEGYDQHWSNPTVENAISYYNLPAGTYTFRSRAISEAGYWSDPISYTFTIIPPWWFTWWAFGIYFLLGLFLIYRMVRMQVERQKRKQKREIERARLEEKGKQAEKIAMQAQEIEQSYLELKKKNETILEAQNQLIQKEKMASLGQMTAGIAHEIKNPLNFVNNFAEGSYELVGELSELLEKYRNKIDDDAYQQIIAILTDLRSNSTDIHNHGSRVDRIIHSMMDHARGVRHERHAVDINQLLDDNINLAYHGYRALDPTFHVRLEKEYDRSLTTANIFPQDLGRVLLNLLNNACYAVSLKQKTQPKSYEPVIIVSSISRDNHIEIRIRDNGPGIPENIRKKIFEPFYTTKPTGAGNTGLGLSISYDIIIKGHQGNLQVESEIGKFTEFIIRIPK